MSNIYHITAYQDNAGNCPWNKWLAKLRDARAILRISQRVKRMETGNFGDHKSLGLGLFEARIDYGPGYRIYYAIYGNQIVLIISGGDKRTQTQDIAFARTCKNDYEARK